MTTLRISQLSSVVVGGNIAAPGLRVSQFGAVAVASNPAAAGLRLSQFITVAVTANARSFLPMGPPVQLNCWTPCGTLLWNGV